jgi:aspartokinase
MIESEGRDVGEKIPMEGVSVSRKMARVCLSHGIESLTAGFIQSLAQARINMNLLVAEEGKYGCRLSCCVAEADASRAISDSHPDLNVSDKPVGLISIFPLRSSLQTLGLALAALAEARVPIHAFCSSLSALTFVIDHDRLQEALEAFEGCFDFPVERPSL